MKEPDILSRIDRHSGMTVPDGYFSEFQKRMAAELPEQSWEKSQPKVIPKSFWQKVRPYVYLAAMFMGIWCMMKMFDLMHPASRLDIEGNPALMSAINNDDFYYDNIVDDFSDSELYDDLYDQGFDPSELSGDMTEELD